MGSIRIGNSRRENGTRFALTAKINFNPLKHYHFYLCTLYCVVKARIFEIFYESLYKKQHDKDDTQFFASGQHDTPAVTEEEVQVALKKIKNGMDREQTRDQVGFRKLYSCEDHLLVITLVAEMHLHSGSLLWIAALGFKKAQACGIRCWSTEFMRIMWM